MIDIISAAVVSIGCGVATSLHVGLNEDYNYNAIHPYCKIETEDNLIAGAYYNSVRDLSIFAGYEYDFNDDTSIEFGLTTGYFYDFTPTVRVNYKNWFLMPAMDNGEYGIVIGVDYEL